MGPEVTEVPWFPLIGLLLTGITMLSGVWYRLHSQINSNREHATKEAADIRQANALQFSAVYAVLAEFKLEVARNYATNAAIREVENRIVAAIERLGDRLDKFSDNHNRA
jgi:hypothetical protein